MIYVVKKGETLHSISSQTGVPVCKIIHDNHIMNWEGITEGQSLLILKQEESFNVGKDMYVAGYTYPFIEPYILEQAFPALNELLVFSYGFDFTGRLNPPIHDIDSMIEAAWEEGVEPLLVLTPFSRGGFGRQLVEVLVENTKIQKTVIENLIETVEKKNYSGVNIFFGDIYGNSDKLYQFVERVKQELNRKGYQMSVTVTMSMISEVAYLNSTVLLADKVFLMLSDVDERYRSPEPIAPLNKVRKTLDMILKELPENKIMLGIPNFGYDWELPYEEGITKAKTIGNMEALGVAIERRSIIQYDDIAQSPYYTYVKDNINHEVWFDDMRSINAKFELAREYGLYGIAYWNLLLQFPENWNLL